VVIEPAGAFTRWLQDALASAPRRPTASRA